MLFCTEYKFMTLYSTKVQEGSVSKFIIENLVLHARARLKGSKFGMLKVHTQGEVCPLTSIRKKLGPIFHNNVCVVSIVKKFRIILLS